MRKLLVANWKAHKNIVQAEYWLNNFPFELLNNKPNLRLVIAPPYPFLSRMQRLIEHQALPVELAVQDVSAYGEGAFTGEVAASNLEFLAVKMAIVGHSERRRLFGENCQQVSEKVHQAQAAKLEALLCLDESNIQEQAKLLTDAEKARLHIAYEPAAAIGSGQALTAKELVKVWQKFKPLFPDSLWLYGGSVDVSNVDQLLAVSDGLLIGGAALDLHNFSQLITATTD